MEKSAIQNRAAKVRNPRLSLRRHGPLLRLKNNHMMPRIAARASTARSAPGTIGCQARDAWGSRALDCTVARVDEPVPFTVELPRAGVERADGPAARESRKNHRQRHVRIQARPTPVRPSVLPPVGRLTPGFRGSRL